MEANRIVLEAIATRKCLEGTYNRMAVTLAPHILYTRHDELYVDAVTVERDGRPPRELKLGSFKVSGIHDPRVGDRSFEPAGGLFDRDAERYAGTTLFAI
jgi:hypothetical protein